jgi:hypothetical protein
VSLAAVLFVAASYLIGKVIGWHDHDKRLRLVVVKFCGLVGFFLAGIHAFMSVVLMKPGYFGKYFDAAGRPQSFLCSSNEERCSTNTHERKRAGWIARGRKGLRDKVPHHTTKHIPPCVLTPDGIFVSLQWAWKM